MSLSDLIGGGPEPDPAQRARIERFQRASAQLQAADREAMLAWAPLFCTCVRHWVQVSAETPPGHALCVIHGQFMITWDGRVL